MKIAISGNNYELNDKITEYVEEKIERLEKYLPKGKREGVHAKVVLTLDESGREDNQCVCEAEILGVPNSIIQSKEATLNMFAAVDIVEAKLKSQIGRYKAKTSPRAKRGQIFVDKLLRRHVPEE